MDDAEAASILDYVIKEYLEEGDDREIDETTPAHHGRHRGLVLDGVAEALPGEEVRDPDPDDEATPQAFDTVTSIAELVTHIREAAPRWLCPRRSHGAQRSRPRALPGRACGACGRAACSRRSASSSPARGRRSTSSSRPASRPGSVINLCANNYLGLSSHPEVVAAAHDGPRRAAATACRRCASSAAPRTSTASSSSKLTEFLGTEDTLLFPSCMDANAGVFEAVLTEQDVMIADRLVHASIVDGMRLCKAMQDTFKHSDMAHLEEKLQEHQDKRFRMVITDGVFSMDGDLAKLDEIVALAEKLRRHGVRRRLPRDRLHRQDGPRHPRALRRGGQDRRHHDDARQGARRGVGRLRQRATRDRRDVPAAGAAVPVLQHACRRSSSRARSRCST